MGILWGVLLMVTLPMVMLHTVINLLTVTMGQSLIRIQTLKLEDPHKFSYKKHSHWNFGHYLSSQLNWVKRDSRSRWDKTVNFTCMPSNFRFTKKQTWFLETLLIYLIQYILSTYMFLTLFQFYMCWNLFLFFVFFPVELI